MWERDCFVLLAIGSLFVALGIASISWGRHESRSYYDVLSTRHDLREFLEHEPERPEPKALKIGGWIAIAIGLPMMAMGGAFWLWN
ncbi:hypothetical protein ACFLWZ_04005 [Chloroflexota bacterium]